MTEREKRERDRQRELVRASKEARLERLAIEGKPRPNWAREDQIAAWSGK